MFLVQGYMFQVQKHMFSVQKHMFTVRKHKISNGEFPNAPSLMNYRGG